MTLADEIRQRLAPLTPEALDIEDDSAAHAGHAGNSGGGHFNLVIVSNAFEGRKLLERHRMVKDLLKELMPHRIHALSIRALTPTEF
ncbi:BolA family protein [Chitinilyticum piscinae]|uniref:BolA family transcriptional regulator n=1 Tax=Chitinilyticum piscinae TaxID=2866724 RepID=A0A8J7FJ76_9NEIS|nr:BolA family protein [Chitinilyticum piscinae]MBE9610345.1 BolA family transcriptional regulator [Chitinilyticum piscinae]